MAWFVLSRVVFQTLVFCDWFCVSLAHVWPDFAKVMVSSWKSESKMGSKSFNEVLKVVTETVTLKIAKTAEVKDYFTYFEVHQYVLT